MLVAEIRRDDAITWLAFCQGAFTLFGRSTRRSAGAFRDAIAGRGGAPMGRGQNGRRYGEAVEGAWSGNFGLVWNCDGDRRDAGRCTRRPWRGVSRHRGTAAGVHVRRFPAVLGAHPERERDRRVPAAGAAASEQRVPLGLRGRGDTGGRGASKAPPRASSRSARHASSRSARRASGRAAHQA
jgi:hypothetical protein